MEFKYFGHESLTHGMSGCGDLFSFHYKKKSLIDATSKWPVHGVSTGMHQTKLPDLQVKYVSLAFQRSAAVKHN